MVAFPSVPPLAGGMGFYLNTNGNKNQQNSVINITEIIFITNPVRVIWFNLI
jgi:hypothetical protein